MTDLENALRDALAARADGVTADPAAYAAVVRRRERRDVRRLVAVSVAAASVAAAGVTFAIARPAPAPAPPAAPVAVAPAPKAFAAVVDGMAALYYGDGNDFEAVTPAGYRTTSVAAYGDGRRFVTAALKGCRTTFTHYELTQDTPAKRNSFTKDVPGGDVAGRVIRMAVSPDRTRLAYALLLPLADGRCGDAGEIRVRDLRSGTERSWDDGQPVTTEPSPFAISSLTWSADGRRLSLGKLTGVLDTTLPGAKVEHLPYENYDVPGYDVCATDDRVFRGTTGGAVLLRCTKDGADGIGALRNIAFAFDPVTGQVGEQLFALPLHTQMDPWSLAFDSSGDHALLTVRDLSTAPPANRVYRWDRDQGVRELDLGDKDVLQIAW